MNKIDSLSDIKFDNDYLYDHTGYTIKKYGKGEVQNIVFKYERLRTFKIDLLDIILILLFFSLIHIQILYENLAYMKDNNIPWHQILEAPESRIRILIISTMSIILYLLSFLKRYQMIVNTNSESIVFTFKYFEKKNKIFNLKQNLEQLGWVIAIEPNQTKWTESTG
jgi:hypothetical protein